MASIVCIAVVLTTGCASDAAPDPTETLPEVTPTPYGEQLLPVGAVASSETAFVAANVIDGVARTPWQAAGTDTEWISVDLGDTYQVTRVLIRWEPINRRNHQVLSPATDYELQISDDGESWTTLRSLEDADGGVDDFTGLDATGRHVRVYATEVTTEFGELKGYQIFEIEFYGEAPTG
jgi:hypothetical protein